MCRVERTLRIVGSRRSAKKKATPVIHRPLWLCDFLFVFCTMTVRRRGKWRRAAEDEIPMRNEQTSSESRECKEHHQESLIYTPLLPSPILSPLLLPFCFLVTEVNYSSLFSRVRACCCYLIICFYFINQANVLCAVCFFLNLLFLSKLHFLPIFMFFFFNILNLYANCTKPAYESGGEMA